MTNLINEENSPFTATIFSLNSEEHVDGLNVLLARATGRPFVTPYVAIAKIQKILAVHQVFLPKIIFKDIDHGNLIFGLDQFGQMLGQTDDGEFKTTPDSENYLYFEYTMNEDGYYDVYCEIVDEDDLDEIMSDYESETDDPTSTVIPTSNLEGLYDVNKEEHAGMRLNEERVSFLKGLIRKQ